MKKIYIAMAVITTAALASCQQEKSFEELTPLGENDIAFVLQGVSTRSMEARPNVVKGVSIPVGESADGESFFLDETIEELNPTPGTRGIPAYTSNVGKLYTTMGVYADQGTFGGDATFEKMDNSLYPRKGDGAGEGWRYYHNYNGNPWPDKTTPVDFYLRMPASGGGASEFEYSDGTIDFDFGAFLKGEEQQDILFSHTAISKETHDGYLPNGAPVNMIHALTGVKFRSGNNNSGSTKTIITKVEFTGLYGSGHCTITPSTGEVVWGDYGSKGVTFSQDFKNPEYDKTLENPADNVDGTVSTWNADLTGTTWTSAAADKNLNEDDGSLTFWFIPQAMTKDVVLNVTFCIKTPDTAGAEGGGMITHTIKFGDLTRKQTKEDDGTITYGDYANWKAGQLRTYTLEPKDVDVAIVDEMHQLTKENLHVANTGNVDEFVRVMVVGNWYDSSGDILVGYKYPSDATTFDTGDDINTMVTPWYREDSEYGKYFDDTFKFGKPAGTNKWKRGTGSYFYYPTVIGAGKTLSGTDALFQSYELPASEVPEIWIPSGGSGNRVKAEGVHLVMEVVVQAIGAGKPDGSGNYESCWDAWTAAVGSTIKEKPFTD